MKIFVDDVECNNIEELEAEILVWPSAMEKYLFVTANATNGQITEIEYVASLNNLTATRDGEDWRLTTKKGKP